MAKRPNHRGQAEDQRRKSSLKNHRPTRFNTPHPKHNNDSFIMFDNSWASNPLAILVAISIISNIITIIMPGLLIGGALIAIRYFMERFNK